MAWYYCSNPVVDPAHATPPLYTRPAAFGAPHCAHCGNATTPCDGVLRYQRVGDYQVRWRDVGADLFLSVEIGVYRALLSADVLATDTPSASFNADMALNPPGGGEWFAQLSSYGGGARNMQFENGLVAARLNRPTLTLGRNGDGAHGLAHILNGHPDMFRNLQANPAGGAPGFDLTSFRDNLRAITGNPTGIGTGVRRVARQAGNGRYGVHGVAQTRHAMVIVDPAQGWRVTTAYRSNVMSGLGQHPRTIRSW